MIDIKINITNKIANAIGTPFIVCGNSDYTVTFTFDAEWGAYQEKTARFFFVSDGIEQYIDVLFSGNTCNAPVLPNIEKVLIGVYTGNLRTTTGAEVRCKRSILFGGKVHEPPTTEDVYNEILEIVGKKLGSEGGTVTGDYFKDGNTFIHEGNLDLLDGTDNLAITKTATGSAITIESSQAPLQNLKLYGKTEQDGTPTPTEPKALKSVGDSGSFRTDIFGKNFLNVTATTQTMNGITFTVNADKSVTVTGTATAMISLFLNTNIKSDLIVGQSYIFTGGNAVHVIYNDGTIDYFGAWSAFTVTSDMKQMCPYIQVNSGDTVNQTYYPFIRPASIEYTGYEPYKTKQSITFTDTLRSIPNTNIQDVKDFTIGKTTKKVHQFTFNGSEEWEALSNGRVAITVDSKYAPNVDNNGLFTPAKAICNMLQVVAWSNLATIDNSVAFGNASNIGFKVSGHTDSVDAWKTYLASNPVTIVYEMKAQIETDITETELNAYRHIMTNKGITTILSEAEAEVDYYINKPNAQAIGDIHSQVNNDYFKLQQAIISLGGN